MDITHRMFAFVMGVILLVVAGLSLLFSLPGFIWIPLGVGSGIFFGASGFWKMK